ncbi:flagellar hook-basal body complex protein FliE [Tissierella creatinophila]|uniref:Flagellar hook-basal body complex protein FliE n=1 Tax=Tissierella creatinophila DSM 6911 TaxID=1123403 RepID=A0A1U7M923_TISCR|nr:flagellar hook-basal body complex protein FliE [Tissierella creatinophila]OLS03776.1 flagellar hook-basal body complex protein FliE [Tissierella creatinophila DSM 6911]
MNVLSLYNKAFLNNNQITNEKMQGLNGIGDKLHTKEKNEEKNDISFADMMNKEIDKVNSMQINADNITNKFMTGEIDDLHSVMIATEEARISLELAVQVRNKCIEAFKEINNMQL